MVELLPAPEDCGLPVACDIIPIVQEWIDEVGIEQAFKIVGTILLYSGPRDEVYNKCLGTNGNHAQVLEILKREKNYTLLDKTETGLKFDEYGGKGINLFEHLKTLYAEKYKDLYGESFDIKLLKQAKAMGAHQANLVMTHFSEMFINIAHGDVETCVCGADPNKVFCTTEMPALMNNRRITEINGVDIEIFRKVYFSGEPNAKRETFLMICEAELSLIHERAMNATGEKAAFLMADYETRKQFFDMDKVVTAEEAREEALKKMTATKTEIEGPAPSRPAKVGKIIPIKKTAGLQ